MRTRSVLPWASLILVASADAAHAQNAAESPVRSRTEDAQDGYTLVAPINSNLVYLVDMAGKVVHEWKTNLAPGEALYMLDDPPHAGHLLRCGRLDNNPRFHGGGIGGSIQEIDWDGNVVWEYKLADEHRTAHHDVARMPSGNVLVIAWEHRSREEAIAHGRDPAHVGDEGFWPDAVFEIKPKEREGGDIVWEWHVWDHLIQDFDPKVQNFGSIPAHPELIDINVDHRDRPPMSDEERKKQEELERQMRGLGYVGGDDPRDEPDPKDGKDKPNPDWLHTNSIQYRPASDLILLSSPHLSEIFVIDHSTTTAQAAGHSGGHFGKGGDLLYRWGNPRNYGAGTDSDRTLFRQHDAQWLPGKTSGEVRVLVFNNGPGRPEDEYSSVDELILPFDAVKGFQREAGQPFGPAALAWTYSDPGTFYSPFISGAQRLRNGDTLICAGAQARIFEIQHEGWTVWDYDNPHGGEVPPTDQSGTAPPKALFRATRLYKDQPALAGRTL